MADFGRELRVVNGKVTKVAIAPIEKEVMVNNLGIAMNKPYQAQRNPDGTEIEGESDLVGLTYGEAIAMRRVQRAARDNSDSLYEATFVYDRLIGKPKQVIESTNHNVNYRTFLQQCRVEDVEEAQRLADEGKSESEIKALEYNPTMSYDDMLRLEREKRSDKMSLEESMTEVVEADWDDDDEFAEYDPEDLAYFDNESHDCDLENFDV